MLSSEELESLLAAALRNFLEQARSTDSLYWNTLDETCDMCQALDSFVFRLMQEKYGTSSGHYCLDGIVDWVVEVNENNYVIQDKSWTPKVKRRLQ